MFSQTKYQQRSSPRRNSPYKQNTNGPQLQDKRSISPSTKPTNLPLISSFKTIPTGIPKSVTNLTKLTPVMQAQMAVGSGLGSRIITLVSVNQGTLHFQTQADNVLQRYQNNQIAFVGIWGSHNSDKSFFYDRLLNLCDIEGDKYANTSFMTGSSSLLYFYQRPFVKDKLRFFLVDCKGYKNASNLTKIQKNQLDILISICQVIILIQDPSSQNVDVIQRGYQHINQSFQRIYIDKKRKKQQPSQICWPKSLFILYNTTSSLKKHKNTQQSQSEQQLCKMFKDYNFSILHNKNACSQQEIKSYTTTTNPLDQLYLKNCSIIFREIYDKIQGKRYMNIKYNGLTCPHILAQIVYTINLHENIYLPKTFNKAKRSIFSSIYNHHALAYLPKMKQYVPDQKSYNTDYLLNAFQNVSEQIMEQYYQTQNQVAIRPDQDSLCIQYEKKLQQYIQQKQKAILAINSKKSNKQLNRLLNANLNNAEQQLKNIQNSLLQNKRSYDHNAESIYVGNTIKSILAKSYVNGMNNQAPLMPAQYNYQPDYITNNPNIINRLQPGETVVYGNNNQFSPQQVIEEIVTYEQPSMIKKYKERQQAQINEKRRIIALKQSQLQQITTRIENQEMEINRQINRFKIQEKVLQDQIKNQQIRLRQLRAKSSPLQSNMNRSSANQQVAYLQEEIQQLKRVLASKVNERRKVQQMQGNPMNQQALALQNQLNQKRQQIQLCKSTLVRQQQVNVGMGYGGAEKRIINPRDANIRRVHGSRV